MTKHQTAFIASKLLGVYCIIQSFGYLSAISMQISWVRGANVGSNDVFLYSIPGILFIVTVGIGLVLLFQTGKVATLLVGEEGPPGEQTSFQIHEFQTVAFSIVGVYLTAQALPHFVGSILNILFSIRAVYIYIDLTRAVVELVLGIWLAFGASRIAILVNKIRGDF